MKRFFAWLLIAATMLSLCGCGSEEKTAEPVKTETPAPVASGSENQGTSLETEPAVLDGNLYLTVSSITFSVVGEQEDIYLGLIPREQVTWESEDPSIVSVENGVLTAAGVGTTVIRGTYEDRIVECTAGCLAATEEELLALDNEILCQPKRLPPELDLTEECTYFDKSAIVGDSITYFLFQWENKTNYLGDMLFLARGGVSMNGFKQRSKNIYYKGKEMNLEKAIGQSKVDRVYFLMGSNDISSSTQRPFLHDNWDIMVERSNIPLYGDEQESRQQRFLEHNQRIVEYNAWLRQFAKDNDCLYIDLYQYVEDHCGRMPKIYNQGSYHMNEAGCLNWMTILRYYAQYELEGGTLA